MLNNPQLILLPQQWGVKSILGTNGTIIFWFFSNSSWLELDEIPDMDKKVLTITHLTDLKDLKTLLKEGLQLFLNENLWKGKFYFLYHLDLSQTLSRDFLEGFLWERVTNLRMRFLVNFYIRVWNYLQCAGIQILVFRTVHEF